MHFLLKILPILALGLSMDASAGCSLNVFVANTGTAALDAVHYFKGGAVKVKGGIWRSLDKGGWFKEDGTVRVNPGQTRGDGYSAALGCAKQRQYKMTYMCRGGKYDGSKFTAYYPSTSSFTTNTKVTIKLPECK